MSAEPRVPMDKSSWGDGPWQTEPDRKEWKDPETGYPCLLNRNRFGVWCGYVAVPPGHPEYGKGYDGADLQVHGGLTYSSKCNGHICHVPEPGEPDDVWWLGFDCGHAFDLAPGIQAVFRECGQTELLGDDMETYRDIAYAESQCRNLAKQLHALA